jgi:hypothetical protein
MTMRLDIMTNDAGENVRRERARELGADVVVELYKLLKLAAVHDLQNQAFLQQLERAHQKIAEYTLKSGLDVSILFAHKAVFVAGQLLRGSRSVYEAAVELGDMMNKIGGSDVFIERDITPKELYQITEAVGNALRNASVDFRSPTPRFRLRAVKDAARLRGLELEQLSPEERIVRGYASAVVVMRRFFEDLSESHYTLPRRLKRVAQTLVDLSEGNVPLFLGVTEARNANFDDAGRAVNSAILAVAMARKLTNDAVVLSKVAIAALVHDVARPRAVALAAQGEFGAGTTSLSEDQEDELPRGTAAVLSALGRLNEASIHRTVIAFEAQWLRRKLYLGQPYGGARDPLLHARIVTMARRFNDAATPEPGLMPKAPDYAIAILDREFTDPVDKTLLRVLAETIRVVPMGSVVELSTGEVAEVERPTSRGERPVVKVVIDARGARPRSPVEIDLSTDLGRSIKRVVETTGWQKGLSLGDSFETDDSPHGPDSDEPASDRPQAPPAPPPGFAMPDRQPPAIIHLAQVAPGGDSPTVTPPKPRLADAIALELEGIPSAPRMPSPSAALDDLVLDDDPLIADDPLVSDDPLIADDPLVSDDPLVADDAFDAAFDLPPPSPAKPPVDDVRRPVGSTMVGGAVAPVAPMAARPPLHFDPEPEPAPREENTLYQASSFYEDAKPKPLSKAIQIARPPAATAEGDLGGTPLPHVLIYMLEHQLDGTLILTDAHGGETCVTFASGTPVKSFASSGEARLGDVLARMGSVPQAAISAAVAAAKPLGVLLGEFLVGEGTISRGQLENALRVQLVERLSALGSLGSESNYAFYQGVDLLEAVTGEPVRTSPLNAILAVVRAWTDDDKIQKTLDRIARAPLRLHPEAELGSFSFAPEEAPLLAALRTGTTTVVEWSYRQGVDVRAMARVLYTLAVTRQFQLSGQTKLPLKGGVPGEFHPPLIVSGRCLSPPSSRASIPPPAPSVSAVRRDDPVASRRPQIRPIGATPRPSAAVTYPSPFDDGPGSARNAPPSAVLPPVAVAPPPEPPEDDPFDDEDDPDGRTLFYTPAAREDMLADSSRGPAAPPPSMPSPIAPMPSPAAAPAIRPAAGAPMIRPAAGAPAIRPAAGAPMVRPAAPAPAVPAPAPAAKVAPAAPAPAPVAPAAPAAPVAAAPAVPAPRPMAAPAVRPAAGAPLVRPPIPAAPRPPVPGVPAIPSVARPAPGLPSASKPAPTAARPLAPLPKPGPKLPSAAPPSAERAAIATGDDALAAAQAARNADLALQKGDLAGAEDAARLAMEKDPNQQEYQALLAWIHSRRDPKRSPQALAVFDRILAASPELERVILYRARVRRELGQGSGAIDDYELLLDLNPLHVEATREILESKRNPGRE